ncbi:ATP-dependent metallopeptidase FtsH/Yme1/Tma family protein, partial [Campylobacterota bacterium]
MKAIKPNFNPSSLNPSNIKIIAGLLVVLIILLSFATLRDTDTLITHDQANILYTEDKIQKVIIDGDFIRLNTDTINYKIYKDAINKTAFFTKYPVEVR